MSNRFMREAEKNANLGAAPQDVKPNETVDRDPEAERVIRTSPQSPPRPIRMGMGGMRRMFTRDGSGDRAVKLVNDLMAVAEMDSSLAVKEYFANKTLSLIPVSRGTNGITFSNVLLAYNFISEEGNEVALVATLILNGTVSAQSIGDVTLNQGRNNYNNYNNRETLSMPYSPSDAFYMSNEYRSILTSKVAEVYPKAEVILVTPMALQPELQELDVTTARGQQALQAILYRLAEALETQSYELTLLPRTEANIFSLVPPLEYDEHGNRIGDNYIIDVGVDYPANQTGQTVLGDTFRQVFTVTSVAQAIREGNTRHYGPNVVGESDLPQTFLAGFPDVVHTGIQQDNTYMPYGALATFDPATGNTAGFTGALVLSMVDSERDGVTLAQLLFAISQSSIMLEKSAWTYGLRPEILSRDHEHNVGVLGLYVPEGGQPINQDPYTLKYVGKVDEGLISNISDFTNFVHSAIRHNSVGIYLDFNEATTTTSALMPVYNVALEGTVTPDGEPTGAMVQILNALDEVYNGNFTPRWNTAGRPPLFVSSTTRLPTGYYKKNNGEIGDIREIDMIWMMQNCDSDDTILAFNDAMYSVNAGDSQVRTLTVYNILKQMVPSFQKTGMATRIIVTPAFYELCGHCTMDIGAQIRPSGLSDLLRDNRGLRVVNYNADYNVRPEDVRGNFSGRFHHGNNSARVDQGWGRNGYVPRGTIRRRV